MIEITLQNCSNLDKGVLLSLIKEIRHSHICSDLSFNDIKGMKDKIIHGVLTVESASYLPWKFLDILQKNKIDTIIKYNEQELSIKEFIEIIEEEENDCDEDNEEFDAEEYKFNILQNHIKKIARNIMNIINKDNLLTRNKDDYTKGQLLAYYNIAKQLEKESTLLGIDCEELEKLINICEKNINK